MQFSLAPRALSRKGGEEGRENVAESPAWAGGGGLDPSPLLHGLSPVPPSTPASCGVWDRGASIYPPAQAGQNPAGSSLLLTAPSLLYPPPSLSTHIPRAGGWRGSGRVGKRSGFLAFYSPAGRFNLPATTQQAKICWGERGEEFTLTHVLYVKHHELDWQAEICQHTEKEKGLLIIFWTKTINGNKEIHNALTNIISFSKNGCFIEWIFGQNISTSSNLPIFSLS